MRIVFTANRLAVRVPVVCLLALVVLSDSATAGLFGRIWARRKAELRSELGAQVTSQVDSEVAAAAEQLDQNLSAKLQQESTKLGQSVDDQVAKLRTDTMNQLAGEAKKLEEQVNTEIANLKTQAATAVAEESKKLQQQTEALMAQLRELTDKQMQTAVAKLTKDIDERITAADQRSAAGSADFQKAINEQIAKLREETQKFKEELLAAKAAQTPAESGDKKPAEDKPAEQAAPSPPAEVKEEKQPENKNS